MLSMTKLYQKTKSSTSSAGGALPNSDPRVLTPSSIPIFILPPTRDVISNGNKPELNDSCDCWSLNGGATADTTPSVFNSTSKCRTSPNSSIKNINEFRTGGNNFNQLMINNTRKSGDKTPTTTANNKKNSSDNNQISFKKLNQFFVNKSASASLENLKGENLLTTTRHDTATAAVVGNSGNSRCSSPKFNTSSNNNKKKLVKAKPVIDSNQTSFEMNNSDTLSSMSQLQQQQQQQQQSHSGGQASFLNPTITLTEAFVNDSDSLRKQQQKTLFQNGYLNIDSVMGQQSESDEIESKENYCNLWVNAHSNSNLNAGPAKSKSTSVSNLHDEPASQSKTEEELQREYLVNLLSQLETEQQQQEHNNSLKSDFLQVNKYQQNKRSKSETLLTLVLSNHSSSSNKAIMSNDEHKSRNFLSLIKRHTPKTSRKSSQNNTTSNLLSLLDLENQKKNHRSKSNANLNILRDESSARRFSLRSFFSKSVKSNGDKSSTKNSKKKGKKDNEEEGGFTRNMSNSLSMSVNSNDNTSSRPMTPIKLVSLSNVTGSAIRFHHSFKQNSGNQIESGVQMRTSSETNVEGSSIMPLHIADSKFIRENFLTLTNKREMFQQAKNNLMSSTSLRRDEPGGTAADEDIDKAFSEFLTTSSYKAPQSTTYYQQVKQGAVDNESKSKNKFKQHAHFLSFLFSKKQTPDTTNYDDEHDPNPNLHRRSQTLNASGRNRFKSYLRRKSSLAVHQADSNRSEFDWQADPLEQQLQQQPLIENNRLNLNLLQLEKEFKKVKNKKSSTSTGSSTTSAHNPIETVFVNLNLAQKQQLKDGSKSSHSSLPGTSLKNVIIVTGGQSWANTSNSRENVDGDTVANNNAAADSMSTSSKSKKLMIIDAGPKLKSKFLRVHVDVSVEKLQQNMQGHLLTLNMKNLHVEPLMEINYIKSRMSYLKLELMCQDEENFCENNNVPTTSSTSSGGGGGQGGKLFIKMNRLKLKKCKFDRNLKNFAKPIEFELNTEHFMSVTEEATRAQMRKLNIKLDNASSSEEQQIQAQRKCYLFLFWLELHSYLPISRKTLSSTFRKQKRVFKGECQIVENFVNCTEFRKTFVICEV